MNAGDVIGGIIDRFRRSVGWNLKTEDKKDRADLVLSFLEVLGAANVPVDKYEVCFRQARLMRADVIKKGKEPPFHITPEELVAAWYVVAKKAAETEEKPDLEVCKFADSHIGDERIVEYFPWGKAAVVLPCHVCRPNAHDIERKAAIAEHNKSFASRRLAAGNPPPEEKKQAKPRTPEKFTTIKTEICVNCGKAAGSVAVRLSADFIVCTACHKEIEDLRNAKK